MKLAQKKCIPCEDNGIEPLSCTDARALFGVHESELKGWDMNDTCSKMSYERLFPDFVSAMQFINQVGDVAESAGHHPDISLWYNRVVLDLWTHSIGGLSENDFIVAAKINAL